MCNCKNSSTNGGNYLMPQNNTSGIRRELLNSPTDNFISTNGNSNSQDSSWTMTFSEINQNISRNNLSRLPMRLQKAYFRGLSNVNKLRIYTEKINLLINNDNLSQSEKQHLLSLLSFIKPEYYDLSYASFVENFYNNWKNFAMNNFNWSLEKIIKYVESWQTVSEFDEAWALEYAITNQTQQKIGKHRSGQVVGISCECLHDIYCPGWGSSCDTSSGCEQTAGCGVFGTSACKGTCSPSTRPPIWLNF